MNASDPAAVAAAQQKIEWRRATAFILLLSCPIVFVYFSRRIFNSIIETQLIDYRFFGATGSLSTGPAPYIQAEVTQAIYISGFSPCAAAALCTALFWASMALIYGNFQKAARRRKHLAIVACTSVLIFVALAVDLTDLDLAKMRGVGDIPRDLIMRTLGKLPTCKNGNPLCAWPEFGIGFTHVNLMRAVSLVFGLAGASAFAYAYAVALAAAYNSADAERNRKSITDLTILAGIAFLGTAIAAHYLFAPGEAMISSLLPPPAAEAAPHVMLTKYRVLANSMILYWSVIFSIALAAAYFPALAYFSATVDGSLAITSFWNVAKKVLTALIPLIGGLAFNIGTEVLDALT